MATPKSQRIGIWIIAIVLTIGTLGSFLAMILGNQNSSTEQARIQGLSKEYTAKTDAQTKTLSDKYFKEFSQYSNVPAVFEASSVKAVEKTDLKVGDGAEIKSGTSYSAYYIGWNPKGVVFDQSISAGALKPPIASEQVALTGWKNGVIGMKFGGIREIAIPSDEAYGKTGSGENIPADTPIKFIVMVIPKVTEVAMPAELLQYYQSQYSGQQ